MTIARTTKSILAAVACTPLLFLAGCLERVETITFSPDGTALLSTEFKGTPGDMVKTADAIPEQGSAWAISERTDKDGEGKPRVVRVATLSVPAGIAMPASYAPEGDARAESALRFPTTFKIGRSGPNTYFDFARTYAKRDEARHTYDEKRLTETDAFKKIKDADPETLTDEQRSLLAHTLVTVEGYKKAVVIHAAAATLEADGSWPQEIGLTLRRSVLDFAQGYDLSRALALLKDPAGPARDEQIKQEASAFDDGLKRTAHDMLAKLGVTDAQRERFIAAAKKELAIRAATEDLADERWEVRVTMPGTLAASNADRMENGVLIWEFDSKAFLDRDHVLKATSWTGPGADKGGEPAKR